MQPCVPDPVADVEADPAAVFDAHGADSVDELVASGSPEPAAGRSRADDDVVALFDGGLDDPEPPRPSGRRSTSPAPARREPGGDGRADGVRSDQRSDEVLSSLEAAASETDAETTASPEEPEPAALAPNDPEVADALAAAEDVEDGELTEEDEEFADEIPFFD